MGNSYTTALPCSNGSDTIATFPLELNNFLSVANISDMKTNYIE